MRRFASVLGCCALLLPAACRLQRKQDLRDQEKLLVLRDNTEAARATLLEEIERERSHLRAIDDEIGRLRGEEEVLALELAAERETHASLKRSVDEAKAVRVALESELKAEQDLKVATEAAIAAAKTPADKAALEARLAALTAEVKRIEELLAKAP
jgi:chromosome segregation ATPase